MRRRQTPAVVQQRLKAPQRAQWPMGVKISTPLQLMVLFSFCSTIRSHIAPNHININVRCNRPGFTSHDSGDYQLNEAITTVGRYSNLSRKGPTSKSQSTRCKFKPTHQNNSGHSVVRLWRVEGWRDMHLVHSPPLGSLANQTPQELSSPPANLTFFSK